MEIRQHLGTGLWCRSDGAVCMPPSPSIRRYTYTWTFGARKATGYFAIQFCGKEYCVHRLICEAFYGVSPPGKPFVDHIDRNRSNNEVGNLRWASHLENSRNSSAALAFAAIHGFNAYSHPSEYRAVYYQGHKDTISKRDAAYRASKKEKGLTKRRGPDGKFHWLPFKRAYSALKGDLNETECKCEGAC